MSNRKVLFNKKTLVLLLILLVSTVATLATIAECEGTWEESSSLACPTGSVCAEWDVGGSSLGSCCIAPEELGSGHLEACEGPLIQ